MLKKISITGPESTGKSWLAQNLAKHYNTIAVPEFSIKYLVEHGEKYVPGDILAIAKGQIDSEARLAPKANGLLFCDTDIIVNVIWSKVVFGTIHEWLRKQVIEHKYDLYLLCYPDIEWKDAPFRENPNDRDQLFKLYEEELISLNLNYKVVKGFEERRLKNAINFVNDLL